LNSKFETARSHPREFTLTIGRTDTSLKPELIIEFIHISELSEWNMSRWLPDEELALAEIRQKLKKEISEQLPFPEVVGDRRLLRFYNGNERKTTKAIEAYRKFLEWRKTVHADQVRQDILYGNAKSPMKFPAGAKIIKIAPQIVFTANATDRLGQPLVVETFDFSPKDFLDNITIDEYLTFLLYSLEYRAMALEQISDMREKQYLKAHPDPSTRQQRYGKIVYLCNIRDLHGERHNIVF
jgi:hypothetical protein